MPEQVDTILIAEDDAALNEAMSESLRRRGFECVACTDPRGALEHARTGKISLLLTDLKMPHIDGIGLCERVHELQPDARMVIVTAYSTIGTVLDALRMGIDGYILKPFREEELILNVENALKRRRLILDNRRYQEGLEQMVEEKTRQLMSHQRELSYSQVLNIFAIGNIIEARDVYTRGHTERVTYFAVELAERLGWRENQIVDLGIGSPLHDIGKIGVPDEILKKQGPLTFREFEIMKKHPEIGYRMVRGTDLAPLTVGCIIYHQERFDGRGYPFGLAGENIPPEGRLMAVCDAFDAMTSTRVYRPALPVEKALQIIRENMGAQFDPEMGRAFLELVDKGAFDGIISETAIKADFEALISRLAGL